MQSVTTNTCKKKHELLACKCHQVGAEEVEFISETTAPNHMRMKPTHQKKKCRKSIFCVKKTIVN